MYRALRTIALVATAGLTLAACGNNRYGHGGFNAGYGYYGNGGYHGAGRYARPYGHRGYGNYGRPYAPPHGRGWGGRRY